MDDEVEKGGNVVVDVGEENGPEVSGTLVEAVTEAAIEEGVRTFQSLTDQSRPDERARSLRLSGP